MRQKRLFFPRLLVFCLVWVALPPGAAAFDLKALILMPGRVIAAHAKEEEKCGSCHASLDKAAQAPLCLECHDEIALDREQKTGFHGIDSKATDSDCKACHKEHKGREFNSVPLDPDTFDHEQTNFHLTGEHTDVACDSCHETGTRYAEADTACAACHREKNPHGDQLGDDCSACHSTGGWTLLDTFDHEATDFPLRGAHAKQVCASCHAGQHYQFEHTDCISCHQVRDVHLGRYGSDCGRCHSQEEWDNPSFDHAAETDFKLTGAHSKQSCRACHQNNVADDPPDMECVACHRASDVHAGRHGDQCDSCHNTTEWTKSQFDHEKETHWPLLGAHKKATCLQCHRGDLKEKVSTRCEACHRADDVHNDEAFSDCSACHQPSDWHETVGFDHELTQFPLEGMHAIADCQACHDDARFRETDAACVACHRQDDTHDGALGEECAACHNPNDWALWTFDHAGQTDFDLTGAHEGLSCDSCHRGDDADDVSLTCAGCHVADDRHGGRFGTNCGRCHSSESFGDIQWRN